MYTKMITCTPYVYFCIHDGVRVHEGVYILCPCHVNYFVYLYTKIYTCLHYLNGYKSWIDESMKLR